MPGYDLGGGLVLHAEIDCFAPPWQQPETILLVHGIGGRAGEWFAWVPPLSADYRVIRVDLRGWGRSSVPPSDHPWSMHGLAADLKALLDHLGIDRVHFVGTKLGGRIGLHFARAWPGRLASLTLICTPMTISDKPGDSRALRPTVAGGAQSVADWARRTMAERLGPVEPAMSEWWIALYSAADPGVIAGVYDLAWQTDEYGMLADLVPPVLVIDSDAITAEEVTRAWVARIPDARLVMVPLTTEGRQISASKPAECVVALRGFMEELRKRGER